MIPRGCREGLELLESYRQSFAMIPQISQGFTRLLSNNLAAKQLLRFPISSFARSSMNDEPIKTVFEAEHMVEYMKAVNYLVNKPGPKFLDCGIIDHNIFLKDDPELQQRVNDSGTSDVFQIGEMGRNVTLGDFLDVWSHIANNEVLAAVRYNGRSYFLEGYRLSEDGSTLTMIWGS